MAAELAAEERCGIPESVVQTLAQLSSLLVQLSFLDVGVYRRTV